MKLEYQKILWRPQSKGWIKERKKSLAKWLGNKCVDCGNDDIDVLDFDHRSPAEKSFTIGSNLGMNYQALLREISKCDLRCANCHRKKSIRNKDYSYRKPRNPVFIPYDYMLEDVS